MLPYLLCGAILWGSEGEPQPAGGAAPARPNILFIAIDDLRANLPPLVQTPHMDALRAAGVSFTHAFVQQPVCAASRASMLTGTRPDTTTVDFPYNQYFYETFLPDHPSLPRYFYEHGYYSVAFGKIHHGHPADTQNLSEPYNGLSYDALGGPKTGRYGVKATHEAFLARRKSGLRPAYLSVIEEGKDVSHADYVDGVMTQSVLCSMERAVASGQPFFLAVGYRLPHTPWAAPKQYWDLYDPENIPPVPSFPGWSNLVHYPPYPSELTAFADPETLPDGTADPAWATRLRHGYFASVSFVDALIGELLNGLDDLGVRDDTLIVLWSDHGFHLGERNYWGKRSLYDLDVRVPMIWAGPSVCEGQTAEGIVELLDIFPTLCEAADLPLPAYLEGRSFSPLLHQPRQLWKHAAIFRAPFAPNLMARGVRTHDWLYGEWRNPAGELVATELYCTSVDPWQAHNLAADPAYFPVQKRLARHLGSQSPCNPEK